MWADKATKTQKPTDRLKNLNHLTNYYFKIRTYASVMLVLGSRDTSMTVVPLMTTSLQAVVLRPVTLQAW